MSGPRNRPAYIAGQRKRNAIRKILAAHSPLLRPLTLEQIQARLRAQGIYLAPSTIAYHRDQIRLEEELKDCSGSNSSFPDAAA